MCADKILFKNSTVSNSKFSLLISVSVMQQSVSSIADHDPLLGLPLTPTKRLPSNDCDDELKAYQISLAQLSSNKLARHDQIELVQLLSFFSALYGFYYLQAVQYRNT